MIRVAKVRHANQHAELLTLQLETLPDDVPLRTDRGHWWICYDGDLPVAFAGMLPSRRWSDAYYLCRTGVIRSHRGQGLQKRLIRVRMAYAKKLGMSWLVTDTTDNPASANSLISCGFRLFSPSQSWSFKRSLYWRRKL